VLSASASLQSAASFTTKTVAQSYVLSLNLHNLPLTASSPPLLALISAVSDSAFQCDPKYSRQIFITRRASPNRELDES
jgi:hypothetical protein